MHQNNTLVQSAAQDTVSPAENPSLPALLDDKGRNCIAKMINANSPGDYNTACEAWLDDFQSRILKHFPFIMVSPEDTRIATDFLNYLIYTKSQAFIDGTNPMFETSWESGDIKRSIIQFRFNLLESGFRTRLGEASDTLLCYNAAMTYYARPDAGSIIRDKAYFENLFLLLPTLDEAALLEYLNESMMVPSKSPALTSLETWSLFTMHETFQDCIRQKLPVILKVMESYSYFFFQEKRWKFLATCCPALLSESVLEVCQSLVASASEPDNFSKAINLVANLKVMQSTPELFSDEAVELLKKYYTQRFAACSSEVEACLKQLGLLFEKGD